MTEKFTYACTDGKSIKIGSSQNPIARVKTLTTGNAKKLILLGYFSGGAKLEKEIHHRFQKIRANGEWMIASKDLVEYLNEMISDKLITVENDVVKSYMKIKKE